MGAVMEKLPHPYKLTHKITSKNERGFCVCVMVFLQVGEGGRIFSKFVGYFSQNFPTLLPFFFPIFFFSFSPYIFSKIRGIYRGMREMVDQLRCNYTQLASHFCHLISLFHLFLISDLIFAQLFESLYELCFLQTLYAQKALDVQFLTVLTLFDLELWQSRFHAWKEAYAMLKNFVAFFIKKCVSSNLG